MRRSEGKGELLLICRCGVARMLRRTNCIRQALASLLVISVFLASCKSYITVAGRFGEYAEGGLLRVRTPDTKHLPDPMSSDGWYEQFVVPSIAPDSTGAFSVRVKHRGFGTVYAGEYNRGSWYYLWPGDSVHIESPRRDSVGLYYSNPRSYGLNSLRKWHRVVSYDSLKAQVLRILATYDSSRVDSALFAGVLLGVRHRHRAQYDSLLRVANIPLRVRRALYRQEDYFNKGISILRTELDSLYPGLGVDESDVTLYSPPRCITRSDRRIGLSASYRRAKFSRTKRYKRASREECDVWYHAQGYPNIRSKAMRNQQTLLTGWDFQHSDLDTQQWDALMRERHRRFGGTLLDSLVQEVWAARRLAMRWGIPRKTNFRDPLHQLDSLWIDGTDRRPILLWAWVVGDPTGQRDLVRRIVAEREASRMGVRIVYLSFNERDFNLRLQLWQMGLFGEYYSAVGQTRKDLLQLFGVREYRRSRFALLTHDGKLLDGDLPLPQEGERFLGRIRELLAQHDGEMVEE